MSLSVLGVLVPCRDEATVIARKLANLASLEWPPAAGPHRIVVVDDGSIDATAGIARGLAASMPPGVELAVVANAVRPGKSGAIEAGLRALRGVEVVVLTDADVVFEPEALLATARAFAAEPGLGMACGAQRFVRALAGDGSARGPRGTVPEPAAGLYDLLTARVRRLESRWGRVFSVHGQLLAWRAALGLAPTPGFAADDLDLMVQARAKGAKVRLLREARFLEVKLPARGRRELQELRRARAYLQFLQHPLLAELARRATGLERLHLACYRSVPLASPLILDVAVMWCLGAILLLQARVSVPYLATVALFLLPVVLRWSGPGRRLARLLRLIREARGLEARERLPDRWETPRARA